MSYSHAVIQLYNHSSYSHTVKQSYSHSFMQSYMHKSYSYTIIVHTVIQLNSHTGIRSCSHTSISLISIQSNSHAVIHTYMHRQASWIDIRTYCLRYGYKLWIITLLIYNMSPRHPCIGLNVGVKMYCFVLYEYMDHKIIHIIHTTKRRNVLIKRDNVKYINKLNLITYHYNR